MRGRNLLPTALLIALLVALPARASDKVFDHLVNHLQTRYQKVPMGTGFMGFMARCFSPKGVSGLHMAIFEDVDTSRLPIGEDFNALVRATVGVEMTPLIQSHSKHGEHCSVYLWEQGTKTELMIVASQKGEVVLMKMRVDPEQLQKWLDDPEGMARNKG